MKNNWQGKRVLIIGAARQGQALARFLAGQRGAQVTVNDKGSPDQLQAARDNLADLPQIEWVLGSHPLDILDGKDLVCLSGGVPLNLEIVQETIRRGLPLSNDTEIFLAEVAQVTCRTIGITGSAGKTTVTTLVGRMAQAGIVEPARVWVGGNIGRPLITQVDQMRPDDLVILEISSFQLEQMTHSPQVASVLNITPNHLDRHGDMQAYSAAKARILAFQKADDIAVLNREDPGSWDLVSQVRGRLVTFGLNRPADGQTGTYLEGDTLSLVDETGQTQTLLPREIVNLRGEHNLVNILAACAIAYASGLKAPAMRSGVADFHGVAHRLEFVREYRGATWYNDSIATAPERSMAAIRSFDEPLVLLAGGRDKDLPWDEFARLVHWRIDHLILFGESAAKIAEAIGPVRPGRRPYSLTRCDRLEEAVKTAAEIIEPGDVVLLSPGGTSYDQFRDFEERGEWYRKWVQDLS